MAARQVSCVGAATGCEIMSKLKCGTRNIRLCHGWQSRLFFKAWMPNNKRPLESEQGYYSLPRL